MLNRLAISNYALINKLSVEFHGGLNSVTGETGAGKSIILGALGLIIGNRADLSVLKNKDEKCIVEGIFDLKNYGLKDFFTENDLDYDPSTIMRREITPSGKSRAFVNDTPVNLKTMRALGLKLIDIHSQHQNLELSNQNFQLNLVDTVSDSGVLLDKYKVNYSKYISIQKELKDTESAAEQAKADLDYYEFQYQQLEEANLQEGEQEELEQEMEKLTHAEEIKTAFSSVQELLDGEHFSVTKNLKESQKLFESIREYVVEAPEFAARIESSLIELKDILDESGRLSDQIEHDPERIEWINDRLNVVNSLQQKHHVASVDELIKLKDSFEEKINQAEGFDSELNALNSELEKQRKSLEELAENLSLKRRESFAIIEDDVVKDLKQLGMPKAKFKVVHEKYEDFTPSGKDGVSFHFSANADTEPTEISKIASGGEMSRLMLAVKNLLRTSKALPTVIFDEIDAGVSGEIALKMGDMLKAFSASTQVINITHLPQVAAKGDAHFLVYKYEEENKTFTSIRKLESGERVEELAKMVGGENLSDHTIKTARELLKN